MEKTIRTEFQRTELNEEGDDAVDEVRGAFSVLLETIDRLIPQCRERSLAVTKLQEAFDWTVRGAVTPERVAE